MIRRILSILCTAAVFFAITAVSYAEGAYDVVLTDCQKVLSAAEKAELTEIMRETADDIGINIGVVLTDGIGSDEEIYTDTFLDRNFGKYSDSIVLMLVKTGTGEQDWISCTGRADEIFGDRIGRILDAVYDGLDSDGGDNYPAAIKGFCGSLRNRLNVDFIDKINMGNIGGLIVAIVIAVATANGIAAGYKKKTPISAGAYLERSKTHITQRSDVFLREYTTSVHVSNSGGHNSGHHGGGHHGGGGGHHGGGGGRHR